MPPILFPTTTAPGQNTQESGGRLVNAYAETLGEGAPAQNVIRRAPGLRVFANTGQTGFRGMIYSAPNVYAAFEEVLYKIDGAGTATGVATLTGTEWVSFFRNNKTPTPDNFAVTENGVFTFTDSSVTELVDSDLPQPNSGTFIDGYGFFSIADGRCFSTGLNATTVASTDYIRAEAKPDGLTRAIAYDRELFLCGPNNIEVWSNTGNATGFPFSRTTVIWRGLIGPQAIAGFEDGFGAALIWVSDDKRVHRLNGYTTTPVSPPDLDRQLAAVEDTTTIVASVYVVGGHPCWCVRAPGLAWVYDLALNRWHERRSYNETGWRTARNCIFAFGKWLIGEAGTGRILEITDAVFDEAGEPLVWEVESIAMGAFPARLRIPRADFNFVQGVGVESGDGYEEIDPKVEISWTDDRGASYSVPLTRDLGRQQVVDGRISVNRAGLTGVHGRRWKLRVSAPVYVGLLGGDMVTEARPR